MILRIEGKAKEVFDAIRNLSKHHGAMTLEEMGRKQLLPTNLQNTMPYAIGQFPAVKIGAGYEDN